MANKKIIPVVDALKELYGKLGGTPADVEDISTTTEIIQEIADVATPGGGGGGGGVIYKTITVTETPTEKTYSLNISYQDFIDAIANNQSYIFQFEKRGSNWLYQPTLYAPGGDGENYVIMLAFFFSPEEDGVFQAETINDTLTIIQLIEDNG